MIRNIDALELDGPFGAIEVAFIKVIAYGMLLPFIVLVLGHSIVAMVAVQVVVFAIQSSIDQKRALETAKTAVITVILAASGFVILALC